MLMKESDFASLAKKDLTSKAIICTSVEVIISYFILKTMIKTIWIVVILTYVIVSYLYQFFFFFKFVFHVTKEFRNKHHFIII